MFKVSTGKAKTIITKRTSLSIAISSEQSVFLCISISTLLGIWFSFVRSTLLSRWCLLYLDT